MISVTIIFKGSRAMYEIRKESPGIYQADLLQYEGPKTEAPPEALILLRGLRQWKGSSDDLRLLQELGKQIEANLSLFG